MREPIQNLYNFRDEDNNIEAMRVESGSKA